MDESNVQKTEIPPKEIFAIMKKNIFDNYSHYSLITINKDYLNSRKALFNLLHKITIRMGFKSQTFFLCAHFLDIIFTKKKRINLNLNILGLSCLCLASKYCENDPIVPHLQYFIKIFNHINGYKNAILMSELKKGEVTVLKILNYKLNYFTIYDFNSFLFGHGILKIEQLKDIENTNKKLYRSSRKKFVVNSTNSLIIKNILEKIYKKSRYYLDIIIKNTKICFKYNPLFISIYIMKNSVEEILATERKINLCEKKEKDEFYEKSNSCFKQIMCDFYKINYEQSEQYKKILEDEEINEIFGNKEKSDKLEGVGPAPLADKKINKEEDDNNNYLNTNKNLFVNTYTNGFYSRMKLKENINDITKKRQNNEKSNDMKINRRKIEINNKSESNSEESKEEDDINTNLNINEIQNKKNKERNIRNNNATSYNFYSIDNNNKNRIVQNKYLITTNNREINTTFNKKNIGNNYNLTYSVEPSIKNKISINTNNKEKSSPIKYGLNNNADYTGLKKYVKIKGINSNLSQERNNYFYNMNNINENNSNNSCTDIKYSYNTIKKYEKQPYFKKLINNDSSINSINRTGISSYYLTNTDLNKKLDNNYRNTVNATNINTYNRIKTNNYRNRNIENDSYINEKIDNLNDININKKEQQSISTTSSRFRKMFYRIKREENTNVNDISTEVKNAKDFIIQENDKKNKREIESYTQFNWNKNSNIFIRKNKISNLNDNNINNINSFEDKKNLTTRNFYKKNNISHNNDINRITVNTSHNKNNITVNKIEVNTLENKSSQKVYQSIRKKYLNIKNNKINNNNNIINNSMEVDNNSRTINYFYKRNNLNNNNINSTNISTSNNNQNIKEKYEPQVENKKNKKFSGYSIFNIINKTKGFFYKNNTNNNNQKEENKRINDKKNIKINNNSFRNINNNEIFYKSQDNFYQPKKKEEININNINSRKEQDIKNNSFMNKHLINNKINKENQNSQVKKNPSTIVINNNININIGNKTNNINNEYTKYKNVYKKNSIQPQSNLKKPGDNNNIEANNNYKNINNSKVNKGINFSNIFNKFHFYRKNVNKNNNNNNN